MIKNFVKIAVLLQAAVFLPLNLQAEQNCLEGVANKIKPGSKITIIRADKTKISGTLLSINSVRQSLTISPSGNLGESQSTYEISEFAKVQYKGTGKFKPGIIIPLAILGAVVGEALGDIPFDSGEFQAEAATIGAGAGFLIGTTISLLTEGTFTIECK